MRDDRVKVNSVVELVNPGDPEFLTKSRGYLLLVEKVYDWGIKGTIPLTLSGDKEYYAQWDEIRYYGEKRPTSIN